MRNTFEEDNCRFSQGILPAPSSPIKTPPNFLRKGSHGGGVI